MVPFPSRFLRAPCCGVALAPVAAFLVQVGCTQVGESGTSSVPPAAMPARTPPARPANDSPASASFGKPARVVLLDPGRAPRRALRYSLVSGSNEKIGMTLSKVIDMPVGMVGKSVQMRLPPIRMEMELTVGEKLSDEEVRCNFSVTGVDVLPGGDVRFPAMRENLKIGLQKAVGASGTLILDHHGVNREIALSLPSDMDSRVRQPMESLRRAMEQFSAPVPEEPVGIGARWQVDKLIEQSGLKVKHKASFELVKIEGTRASLKETIAQTADPQIATLPILPAGLTAELLSHSGTGGGSIELDLTRLAALGATIAVKTDTAVKVAGQGPEKTMRVKAKTQVDIGQL